MVLSDGCEFLVNFTPTMNQAPPEASNREVITLRSNVASVGTALAVEHKAKLDELKARKCDIRRPDFLWHALLQSFGTMGRAAGWAGLSKPENYNRIRFDALETLSASERLPAAERVFRNGKVRMPAKKAHYLVGCFEVVQNLGGPKVARSRLLQQPGRGGKIEFLKQFPGIGNKYARNIFMDVYHPDFRDSIAIDARINSLSKFLGLRFRNYSQHEQFYLDAAHEAGLNGWELDRLMFLYLDEFRARLK